MSDSETDMSVAPRPQVAHRYFFAVLPDAVTARRIHAFAEGQLGARGLLRSERLHVTLGLTADFEAHFPALIEALRRAGDRVEAAPFDLALDQLSGGRRTVALRPARSVAPLKALQGAIAQAMAQEGVPMRGDWQFNPHMTLAYRQGEPVTRPVEPFGWPVREFVLIESLVGLARHDVLGRWALRPPGNDQGTLL